MDFSQGIVNQIVSKCAERGASVSTALAQYVTKCYLLEQSESNQLKEVQLSQLEADSLINAVVNKLISSDTPAFETIRMQVRFQETTDDVIKNTKFLAQNHRFKSEKLVEELLQKGGEAEVFGDIVIFILHETHLLDNNAEAIEKETITALESVIPRNFVHSFIVQTREEKQTQLADLWRIVWGIRVFNKATDKGGTGILNYEINVADNVKHLIQDCQIQMSESDELLNSYSMALKLKNIESMRRSKLIEELTYYVQYRVYLEQIMQSAKKVSDRVQEDAHFYRTQIKEIGEIVNDNTSVAKSTIYPMFILLADNWVSFERSAATFRELKQLLSVLIPMKNAISKTLSDAEIKQGIEAIPDEANIGAQEPSDNSEVITDDYPKDVKVSLNGICPFTMASHEIPMFGNKINGVVKYKENYYLFASPIGATAFSRDPQSFLDKIYASALVHTEYLRLLDIFEEIAPIGVFLQSFVKKTTIDCECQTSHTQESNIDYKYEFSEWKLRQRALKYADLRTKKTHSTQTHMSHFRRENETQVYLPKEKTTQTLKEKGTNPIKHVRYIEGLRGASNQKIL